jgi:hypothetical protein
MPFIRSIDRQYDGSFAQAGAKIGDTLKLREPNQFAIRTGMVMDTQDITETAQDLVISTVKGVDLDLSTLELTLDIDNFNERILKPAMLRLAAEIEKTVIDGVYPYVAKFENTTFGTKPVYADVQAARALLAQGLCPRNDRYLMTDALASNSIMADSKTLYNPTETISKQYMDGVVGRVAGFGHVESELTPVHTNGSRDDTTPVIDIATITNGMTALVTTGADGTYKKGDVFTIADVYDVNPETKVSTGVLKQLSMAEDHTNDATDTLNITWPIYKDGPKQNAYAAAWTGSKAIVNVGAGGSGTASTAYRNALAYHKNAFTFVSADLEMPKGEDFAYRAVIDGISMSLVRSFNITNRSFPLRIDVLFGYKCVIPGWACRVCS